MLFKQWIDRIPWRVVRRKTLLDPKTCLIEVRNIGHTDKFVETCPDNVNHQLVPYTTTGMVRLITNGPADHHLLILLHENWLSFAGEQDTRTVEFTDPI
jgi:hypothetical protein